jgi:serpin B
MKTKELPIATEQAERNAQFALDLYDLLRSISGNLFFSPFSISTALAMVHAGARGNTAQQMKEVLHLPSDPKDLHEATRSLHRELRDIQKKSRIQLSVANSLWPQTGYPILKEFLKLTDKYYGTSVTPVDYVKATEQARQRINEWVEEKTEHKIKELIAPRLVDALTRLVLVNAVYFKGFWREPFDETDTQDAPFFMAPDETIEAPLMFQRDWFAYADAAALQLLELPYEGKRLSMVILLPSEKDGLPRLEESLSPENLQAWLGKRRTVGVHVYLPRFRMTDSFELSGALSSMGMPDLFDVVKADLTGISQAPGGLRISAAIHKAFVEVSEEGTEAAAATAMIATALSAPTAPPPPPIIFRADHPFLFLIRENETGSILFLGRVVDPTDTGE